MVYVLLDGDVERFEIEADASLSMSEGLIMQTQLSLVRYSLAGYQNHGDIYCIIHYRLLFWMPQDAILLIRSQIQKRRCVTVPNARATLKTFVLLSSQRSNVSTIVPSLALASMATLELPHVYPCLEYSLHLSSFLSKCHCGAALPSLVFSFGCSSFSLLRITPNCL
jgi:hypothetical protein